MCDFYIEEQNIPKFMIMGILSKSTLFDIAKEDLDSIVTEFHGFDHGISVIDVWDETPYAPTPYFALQVPKDGAIQMGLDGWLAAYGTDEYGLKDEPIEALLGDSDVVWSAKYDEDTKRILIYHE